MTVKGTLTYDEDANLQWRWVQFYLAIGLVRCRARIIHHYSGYDAFELYKFLNSRRDSSFGFVPRDYSNSHFYSLRKPHKRCTCTRCRESRLALRRNPQ